MNIEPSEKVRAIITGATGMIGEGVLHECLQSEKVEKVLVVGRKSCGVSHPKLTEIVHKDFFDLAAIADDLKGYNACFFCLGVSSTGVSNEEYKRLTYDLTMNFAETLVKENHEMTFCYVSGKGTNSKEKSSLNWANVKGKTENDLIKLPFKKAFAFRIGFVKPEKDFKNTVNLYNYLGWLYPIVRAVSTNYASTLGEVGKAMINSATKGYEKQVLEVVDIVELSKR
jgi:NAD dependent epimerase/dehydratase family